MVDKTPPPRRPAGPKIVGGILLLCQVFFPLSKFIHYFSTVVIRRFVFLFTFISFHVPFACNAFLFISLPFRFVAVQFPLLVSLLLRYQFWTTGVINM